MTGDNQYPQLPRIQPVLPTQPAGQDPSAVVQPNFQINPAQFVQKPQSQQQQAYGGSPESGPAVPVEAPKENAAPPEFGYDAIQRIENQPNQDQMEKKEAKPMGQTQQPVPTQPQQPVVPVVPIAPPAKMPRFYGYTVSPQIAKNFEMIKEQKGKGNPNQARTWLYVLLDKLLKKQTYQGGK